MLHSVEKKKAVNDLNSVIDEYNALASDVEKSLVKLYERRKEGAEAIKSLEKYINTLARTPKELKKSIREITVLIDEFVKVAELKKFKPEIGGAGTAAAGSAIGSAVALLGPEVTAAIATTFGKTGAEFAIKELTKKAGKKAALTWLGEGAGILSGSASEVAGQTIAKALGPIGWGITAISIASALRKVDKGNRKLIEECLNNTAKIEEDKAYVKKALAWVKKTDRATSRLIISVKNGLFACENLPEDYNLWGEEERKGLMKTVSKAGVLGELIMLKMESDENKNNDEDKDKEEV